MYRSGADLGTSHSALYRCRAPRCVHLVLRGAPRASADDLADPGCQHIHSSDCPAIVIRAHVERLDVLRVVHHDHWLLHMPFSEIALVFRLQVHAPATGNSNFSFARSSTAIASP